MGKERRKELTKKLIQMRVYREGDDGKRGRGGEGMLFKENGNRVENSGRNKTKTEGRETVQRRKRVLEIGLWLEKGGRE
jgi:hypothetical protein